VKTLTNEDKKYIHKALSNDFKFALSILDPGEPDSVQEVVNLLVSLMLGTYFTAKGIDPANTVVQKMQAQIFVDSINAYVRDMVEGWASDDIVVND
jgi:hypothetical protein